MRAWVILIAIACLTNDDIRVEGCKQVCYSKGMTGSWDKRARKCFCGKHYEYPEKKRDKLDLSVIKTDEIVLWGDDH